MKTKVSFFNFCATHAAFEVIAVPLGPLYLISCLEQTGIEVEFFDYQLFPIENLVHPTAIREFLQKVTTDTIIISCWDHLLPSVLLATRDYCHDFPACRLILGGMGPTGVSR
ncbi:hypothetical protein KAI46_04260, partial [bacterium]|nr:hypothetical protein [bacterium]